LGNRSSSISDRNFDGSNEEEATLDYEQDTVVEGKLQATLLHDSHFVLDMTKFASGTAYLGPKHGKDINRGISTNLNIEVPQLFHSGRRVRERPFLWWKNADRFIPSRKQDHCLKEYSMIKPKIPFKHDHSTFSPSTEDQTPLDPLYTTFRQSLSSHHVAISQVYGYRDFMTDSVSNSPGRGSNSDHAPFDRSSLVVAPPATDITRVPNRSRLHDQVNEGVRLISSNFMSPGNSVKELFQFNSYLVRAFEYNVSGKILNFPRKGVMNHLIDKGNQLSSPWLPITRNSHPTNRVRDNSVLNSNMPGK